ncbi:chemotaxis protein CheY [Pseudomonas carnis]|uniref:chemotaxis protein CheY n=1 Tax=Pseudomonas carnis TaxID=2487355 RepID=UPI0018E65DE7|nr:chemotaxis protein CheY [Pseudomonas carnis]MBI6655508.1 chemotaxis protein CheY [Pseudomonas carnis]MBI6661583.1 chemotaxis protein CheY [Pseudomonas carnis]MBI6687328.1 chemotaxis protein CheY [Pseudomonas carnis]
MTNKALRILLAHEQYEQLIYIEKLLNRLEYYRISPVRTFEEVVLLTSNPDDLFDLLVVEKTLAVPEDVDLVEFCRTQPYIRHTFFYESPINVFGLVVGSPESSDSGTLTDPHYSGTLDVLMNIIDPPVDTD